MSRRRPRMRADFSTTPNRLTLLRILLLPLLWALAFGGWTVALGAAIAIVSATDVLDGYLARRYGQTSAFGSRLDTIADTALMLSILAWLAMLRPAFLHAHAVPLLAIAVIGIAALLIGWFRFGRLWDLHLYSSKAGAFLGYVFAVWILVRGDYPEWLFSLAVGAVLLGATETLLVYLFARRVDERVGTILRLRRKDG